MYIENLSESQIAQMTYNEILSVTKDGQLRYPIGDDVDFVELDKLKVVKQPTQTWLKNKVVVNLTNTVQACVIMSDFNSVLYFPGINNPTDLKLAHAKEMAKLCPGYLVAFTENERQRIIQNYLDETKQLEAKIQKIANELEK